MKRALPILLAFVAFGAATSPVAPRLFLTWDRIQDWGAGPVGGYKVYMRDLSGEDWQEVAYVGDANEWPIETPTGTLSGYAWRVTAYNGLESDPTEEVIVTKPPNPSAAKIVLEVR